MPLRVGDKEVQTRKERRKDARHAKLQQRLHSWAAHQAGKRRRAQKLALEGELLSTTSFKSEQDSEVKTLVPVTDKDKDCGGERHDKKRGRKVVSKVKRPRTKFEEYLEIDRQKTASATAEEDLALEQRLAKKLKVKGGKLRGPFDGLNDILDGIDSPLGPVEIEPGSEEDTVERHVGILNVNSKKRLLGQQLDPLETKKRGKGNSKILVEEVGGSKAESPGSHDEAESDSSVQYLFADVKGEREESNEISDTNADSEVDGKDMDFEHVDDAKVEERLTGGAVEGGKEGRRPSKPKDGIRAEGPDITKMVNVEGAAVKYVPPHLRERAGSDSGDMARVQRRVRGLLNRMSEANLESIASDISSLSQGYRRRMVMDIVTNEIIGACCGGPRGNDQYAAVFAAFVAGTAAMVGIDFGAKFLASLATAFEDQYMKADSLALRNLSLLFSHLYSFGLLPSELVYEVLDSLCQRFQELDVATILTILQSCGMGLRADDPSSMKEFVVAVQQRTVELKASLLHNSEETSSTIGKRVQFMLDMICDIKNNKRRSKDEPTPHFRLKKWLLKLRVGDVQLRAVTWVRLLDPMKKGQWWLPGTPSGHAQECHASDIRAEVAGAMDAGAMEAEKMLQLAASQRMNTDARRSVFCIVMSGEDYIDAFEKILRLKLPGKQDREVVRVIVECCLQEQLFNKYYALLAIKLCHSDKNHKFSLQYCLWDHFKQLDSMDVRRSSNLAQLTASVVGSFALSLAVLKAVDFSDLRVMTSKVVLHFRVVLEHLLTENSDDIVWGVFSRIAAPPELAALRDGLALFLHQHVLTVDSSKLKAKKGESEKGQLLPNRCRLAKKALANVTGVLLK